MRTNRFLLAAITWLAIVPAQLHAQDDDDAPRTLIGRGRKLHHGGWGAPTAHCTRILDQDALLVGARGGWLINHRFTLGVAGHGLVTNLRHQAYDDHLQESGQAFYGRSSFHMGYGGLLLEPIIAYRSPVHVSLPVIIGAGGCGYSFNAPPPQDLDPVALPANSQAFFVVEPGIDLELNLIPLVRLGLGASYRFTSDLDLPGTPKDALHGFNAGINVKVGRF